MNNSSVTPDQLIQKVNDELAQHLIPADVFTYINMVMGLVGNLMVCYYYGFKTKMNPTSVFIVVLAVYDLISCVITMPHEIVLNHKLYTYSDRTACKSLIFIAYFAVIASVGTLPAIAIDRYRHICVSGKYQTTVKDAMKQCAIVVVLAVLFSWPTIVLHDIEVAPLPIRYGSDLQGTSCSRKKALSTYNFVLDVVYFIMYFACMAIIVVLYFRISKVLYIHRHNFGKSETLNSDNRSKRIDRMTAKITIGMFVITIVFFLSFIPRLSLSVWNSIKGKQGNQFLSGAELVGYQIGWQSYMLNNSLNSWIYGIFNSEFRQFYFRKLCRCCRGVEVPISRETTECTHVEQTV